MLLSLYLKGVYIEDIKAKNINNYCYSEEEWHNGWYEFFI
jgi:hypothetical protein